MAYTQQDIDDLERALAAGVRTVKRGDREITYNSPQEMRAQLQVMKDQLSNKPRAPYMYKSYSRGYQ